MWFFSQNIPKLEKIYGEWSFNWYGLSNVIPFDAEYYPFSITITRTWSYNGQSGIETIYPTVVSIITGSEDGHFISYNKSNGSGQLSTSENKTTEVRNIIIKAIYDPDGSIHLEDTFSINQDPVPNNIHILWNNISGVALNVRAFGDIAMLTNNNENDAKGSWDTNHQPNIGSYDSRYFVDKGYINTRNTTDIIYSTKTFNFTIQTYDLNGSFVNLKASMYMTINEENQGSTPGTLLSTSNTIDNISTNSSHNNQYTLTFDTPVTINGDLQFWIYITTEQL